MGLARHNLLLNLNLLKSLNPEPGIPRNEGFKVIILQRPFGAVQRKLFLGVYYVSIVTGDTIFGMALRVLDGEL